MVVTLDKWSKTLFPINGIKPLALHLHRGGLWVLCTSA